MDYPSGASVHVREVASSLRRLGYEVHIISRKVGPKGVSGRDLTAVNRFIILGEGYRKETPGQRKNSTLSRKLYRFYLKSLYALYVSAVAANVIRRNRISAIIERETAFGAGAITSILTGRKLVLEIVGPEYSRLSVLRSNVILYYNEKMLRDWVDRKKCVRITAGANTDVFYPDNKKRKIKRDELSIRESEKVVGYVGTFQSWHGIDTLIRAFSSQRIGNVRCLLVGPNSEKYAELAEKVGVREYFIFTGPVDYVSAADYINACDIMVAPYNPKVDPERSKYGIGWPIKILEYMACMKPVISTSVFPVTEIIKDGVNGKLVPPGDERSLLSAILDLTSNEKLAESFASAGYELVKREYSWARVAKKIEETLRCILA